MDEPIHHGKSCNRSGNICPKTLNIRGRKIHGKTPSRFPVNGPFNPNNPILSLIKIFNFLIFRFGISYSSGREKKQWSLPSQWQLQSFYFVFLDFVAPSFTSVNQRSTLNATRRNATRVLRRVPKVRASRVRFRVSACRSNTFEHITHR